MATRLFLKYRFVLIGSLMIFCLALIRYHQLCANIIIPEEQTKDEHEDIEVVQESHEELDTSKEIEEEKSKEREDLEGKSQDREAEESQDRKEEKIKKVEEEKSKEIEEEKSIEIEEEKSIEREEEKSKQRDEEKSIEREKKKSKDREEEKSKQREEENSKQREEEKSKQRDEEKSIEREEKKSKEIDEKKSKQKEEENSKQRVEEESKQREELNDEAMEAMFAKRRELYMHACANMTARPAGSMFIHNSSKLAVCHTPKIGCTFWKRIMVFLNSNKQKWKSPLDIDRYTVHHKRIIAGHPISQIKELISTYDRVMYTRDPYQRLWSVYIDKIILPDSLEDIGLGINRYLNLGQNECPLNIGFEHFLRFAIYKQRNFHWNPIKTVCDPCSFHPQYIGKMDTFSRDTEYILRKRGLDHLLVSNTGRDHVEDEFIMLVDDHFKLHYSRHINKKCLNETTLAERLWRAFQLNGYLATDDLFPENLIRASMRGRYASDVVTKIFVDHYKQNKRTKSEIKAQRDKVLKEAYRSIPLDLKEDIRKKYDADFKLFGYDPTPSIVFSST